MNCISLVCDPSTETKQIGNFHHGSITSNSWCLFKDIHRLSTGIQVLCLILMDIYKNRFGIISNREKNETILNYKKHLLKLELLPFLVGFSHRCVRK